MFASVRTASENGKDKNYSLKLNQTLATFKYRNLFVYGATKCDNLVGGARISQIIIYCGKGII